MHMRYQHFSSIERLELSVLLKKGYSMREIGSALKKSHSSVIRELARNKVEGAYDPAKADHKSYVKRRYSKYQGMKVREYPELERYIHEKIRLHWSPEEVSGRWKLDHPKEISISPKGIYKYLETQFGESLVRYLPYRKYVKGRRKMSQMHRDILQNRTFVNERPKIIQMRKRLGDFEADTLGKPQRFRETIAGMVDRKSRYFLAKKIPSLKVTIEAFGELLLNHPVHSITIDNGFENSRYEELGIKTYFCHPYAAWEKGSIENTFQRLRRYIPKKANVASYSDEKISAIVERMNSTPRKCLRFLTPKEVFEDQSLAANGALEG